MAISVQIKLNAVLRRYAKEGRTEIGLRLPEGSTIRDVLRELDIPSAEVAFAAVNLKYAECSQALEDEDEVILFPPLMGG